MIWKSGQTTVDGACVIQLDGDLDIFIVDEMRRDLTGAAEEYRHVVLDLSSVRFLDSSALGVLVKTKQVASTGGGAVCLAAPSEFIQRILDTTGLNRVFPTFDDVEEACRWLGEQDQTGAASPIAEPRL
jgi:anti-sigma B factor antagonist